MQKLISMIIFCAFASLCLFGASFAQNKDRIVLKIGERTKAFHPGLNGKTIEGCGRHPMNMTFLMDDLLEAVGLKKDVLMLEADVDNALALIDFAKSGEPFKLIVYNVEWLSDIYKPSIKQRCVVFCALFVIAHEMGHHACQHTAWPVEWLALG